MLEPLEECINRYEKITESRIAQNISEKIITQAKPELISITKGDTTNIKLWIKLMKTFHPRGYNGSVGRNIKFFVVDKETQLYLGALSIGTPVYALSSRDKFIGWSKEQREEHINKNVANNWRFLIFPYVDVKNLGSKILSKLNIVAKSEWMKRYGDRLLLLETFVDDSECKGAGVTYKASGWFELLEYNGDIISHFDAKKYLYENLTPAKTKGYKFVVRRGLSFGDYLTGTPKMPLMNTRKKIFLKPLHRYWRKKLCKINEG